jgi:hypothetical protein
LVNLIIKSFTGQSYELTSRSNPSRSSSAKRYSSDSYSTFRFVATLPLAPAQWVQILKSTHQRLPDFHSSHPGEVYQAVAEAIVRGDLSLYQLPSMNANHCLAGKKGFGLSIIKGPKPHSSTDLSPESIKTAASAQQLLAELGISNEAFLGYLSGENLYNSYQKRNPLAEALGLLATGELLAYKIPLPPKTPSVKAQEFLPVTAADRPVPLAPEASTSSASSNTEKPPAKKAPPQTLDDCAHCLKDARERLITGGYQAKYTDEQQLAKVKNNEVSQERFLVSFQTKNIDPDAKLAYQRDSKLVPIWATSFDQLENADTDPKLIADIGQNTLIPTWDNMQEPTQKYLGGKHDSAVLSEVMTPEYQKQYAKDIEQYHMIGLNEFNPDDQKDYLEYLPVQDKQKFSARHNVRTEIGANSEFTGNGLTQSSEGSTRYGVVETLTLENNPPPISGMTNVKTIELKPIRMV